MIMKLMYVMIIDMKMLQKKMKKMRMLERTGLDWYSRQPLDYFPAKTCCVQLMSSDILFVLYQFISIFYPINTIQI